MNTQELIKNLEKLNTNTLSERQADQLRDTLIKSAIHLARDSFYVYVLVMASVVLPEGFVNGRHIKIICDNLNSLESSVARSQEDQRNGVPEELQTQAERLQIFLPPGGMKSMLLKLFVTWCFGRHPKWRFLHFGFSTQFAIDNFGRPIKETILSPEYQAIFPKTKLKIDAQKAQSFETTEGGTYYCAGAGTGVAGRRAHITICDDVISEQTAYSKTERTKINKWYTVGPRQRLLACGGEVIVNTRWHIDDLSGSRSKADGVIGEDSSNKSKRPWKVISFPAILDKKGSDLLGLEEGSSFWPELWPKNRLLEFKDDPEMPPSRWNALYMQNPTPDEGNIVKHEQWKRWRAPEPPEVDYIIASADTAFSSNSGADYSAISVWGVFRTRETLSNGTTNFVNNLILLSAKKGRWEFPDLLSEMVSIKDEYNPDAFIIEKKGSGQSLIQEMRRRDLPVLEYLPEKDKLTRLHSCTPFFHAGRIWVPADRNWAEEVIEEVCGFPYAANDDFTDTVSQAIIWMRDSWNLSHPDDPNWDEEYDWDNKTTHNSYWSSVAY